ncbi:MAG: L,D-transpeptidase family protein [Gammaproteobacteria bacterium]
MPHRRRPSVRLAPLGRALAFSALASAFAGCSLLTPHSAPLPPQAVVAPTQPDPNAPRLAALDTRHFALSAGQELVGEPQVLFARYENTFSAVGREYDLGYEEMRRANPGVDQWLPGEGTPIYLPTQSILPDSAHKGIVINVPAMRLYYFTSEKPATTNKSPGAAEKPATDAAAVTMAVTTYPIGIGAEGWATPFGEAKVTQKARNPVWYVPASVRKEHLENGDKLPSVVPAGPDNPLGAFAMTLSIPSYLIHGTNKPDGVGMRSSHGCIRLYPEDIEALFGRVPKGTPVHIVNQPLLAAWRDGQLYLEVHPPLTEEQHDLVAEADSALKSALERAGSAAAGAEIDPLAVRRIVTEQRGMPLPVLRSERSLEQYLATSRIVVNTVPVAVAEEGHQAAAGAASAAR